ncbi:MAG: class I SAM-dependent methyltransferase [Saprospiraceae bacterium]|nr:class I SAM-dependent methyltransferase [Saprospiraceae bacterium]
MSSVQYFKEVASEWDQMADSFFGESPRKMIYDNANWSQIKTVADLGCGAGYLTEGLADRDVKVTAIDQSQEMLDMMKSKLGEDRIDYLKGDGGSIPLEDNSIDLAIANMFLHHVDHPPKTIKEAYRIVKPGGQWIFTDLDEHENEFLVTEQHDKWMGFKREDITKWMTEAGFINIEIDCVGADCCASSSSSDPEAKVSIFMAKGEKPV